MISYIVTLFLLFNLAFDPDKPEFGCVMQEIGHAPFIWSTHGDYINSPLMFRLKSWLKACSVDGFTTGCPKKVHNFLQELFNFETMFSLIEKALT